MTCAIVRAWKTEGGGNIYIDGSPKGWELIHGDTEWVYDWHKYWPDKADPGKIKPVPVARVTLSSC